MLTHFRNAEYYYAQKRSKTLFHYSALCCDDELTVDVRISVVRATQDVIQENGLDLSGVANLSTARSLMIRREILSASSRPQ
jgi:hypothetical protein